MGDPVLRQKAEPVASIDDDVRRGLLERPDQRDAVVLPAAQLLGAAEQERADDLVRQPAKGVADDRCVRRRRP